VKHIPRPVQSHLFFAVFVPLEVQPVVAALQAPVRGGWRATPSEQLHITLAFLGAALETPLPRLLEIGRSVAATTLPFTVHLRGTGFFPQDASPRVWFLKAEAPELHAISSQLHQRLELESQHRFQPHVTLARKRERGSKPPTLSANLEFPVYHFALVRSFLEARGSRFKTLEKFFLSPSPVAQPTLQQSHSTKTTATSTPRRTL
jgi:2'-5' RNA ligase